MSTDAEANASTAPPSPPALLHGAHLATALDVDWKDGRAYALAPGCTLTTVYLEDVGLARSRHRRRQHHTHVRDPADEGEEEEEEGDAFSPGGEDAAALAALGLPVGFGGRVTTGAAGPRSGRRRSPAPATRPESTGLLAALPVPAGTHVRWGGGGEGEGRPPPPPSPPRLPPSPPSPPRPGRPSGPAAAKYWRARYSLWGPAFDDGISMDAEGWFSATPAALATHQAGRLLAAAAGSGGGGGLHRPRPLLVLDAFCGCGGNAARLALAAGAGSVVLAVDAHAGRAGVVAANAALVAAREAAGAGGGGGGGRGGGPRPAALEVVVADFFDAAPRLAADAVFMSPPWGGPAYAACAVAGLGDDVGGLGVGLAELLAAAAAAGGAGDHRPPAIAAFLPRNASLRDIVAAVDRAGLGPAEVERAVLNGRVKGVTLYCGGRREG